MATSAERESIFDDVIDYYTDYGLYITSAQEKVRWFGPFPGEAEPRSVPISSSPTQTSGTYSALDIIARGLIQGITDFYTTSAISISGISAFGFSTEDPLSAISGRLGLKYNISNLRINNGQLDTIQNINPGQVPVWTTVGVSGLTNGQVVIVSGGRLATSAISFTRYHGDLTGLMEDHHTQYLILNPTTSERNVINASDVVLLTLRKGSSSTQDLFQIQESDQVNILFITSAGTLVTSGSIIIEDGLNVSGNANIEGSLRVSTLSGILSGANGLVTAISILPIVAGGTNNSSFDGAQFIWYNGSQLVSSPFSSGTFLVSANGTIDNFPKFIGRNQIGNSIVSESGNNIIVNGGLTINHLSGVGERYVTVASDGSLRTVSASIGSVSGSGSGTIDRISKFITSATLGDSIMREIGSLIQTDGNFEVYGTIADEPTLYARTSDSPVSKNQTGGILDLTVGTRHSQIKAVVLTNISAATSGSETWDTSPRVGLSFYTMAPGGLSEAMRLTDQKELIVGKIISNGRKLQVVGDGDFSTNLYVSGAEYIHGNLTTNTLNVSGATNLRTTLIVGSNTIVANSSGRVLINTATDHGETFQVDGNSWLNGASTIASSLNVSGTTTLHPFVGTETRYVGVNSSGQLTIVGNVSANVSGTVGRIPKFATSLSLNDSIMIQSSSTIVIEGSLSASGNAYIVGNVGIGNISPAASLQISKQTSILTGTGNTYGMYIYPTSSGEVFFDALTNLTSNTLMRFRVYNNGTYYDAIRVNNIGDVNLGSSLNVSGTTTLHPFVGTGTRYVGVNSSGQLTVVGNVSADVSGSINRIPRFITSISLGDSGLIDDGISLFVGRRNSYFGDIPVVLGVQGNGYPSVGYNFSASDVGYTYRITDTAYRVGLGTSNLLSLMYAPVSAAGSLLVWNTGLSINQSGLVSIPRNLSVSTNTTLNTLNVSGTTTLHPFVGTGTRVLGVNSTGQLTVVGNVSADVSGSINRIPKFATPLSLNDSLMLQTGSNIIVEGSLSASGNISTNTLNVSGLASFGAGIKLNGNVGGTPGMIYGQQDSGTVIYSRSGTSSDFLLANGVGSSVMTVLPGTTRVVFYGPVSAASTITIGNNALRVASNGRTILNTASDHGETFQVDGTVWLNGHTTLGSSLNVSGSTTLGSTAGNRILVTNTNNILTSQSELFWNSTTPGIVLNGTLNVSGTTTLHPFIGTGMRYVGVNSAGQLTVVGNVSADVSGSINRIPKFSTSISLNDSIIRQESSTRIVVEGEFFATNLIYATTGIYISGGSTGIGKITSDSFNGTVLWSQSGSNTDFTLLNRAGSRVFDVSPNTQNTIFYGQVRSDLAGTGPSSGILVRSTSPALGLYATVGSTDNRSWDLLTDGSNLYLRVVNDANSTAGNALEIARSGTTINTVRLNGDVGIGITPTDDFEIARSGGLEFQLYKANSDVDPIYLKARRARGSVSSPSNVNTGDDIISLLAQPRSGSFFDAGYIACTVEGTVTNGQRPGTQWRFATNNPDTAASTKVAITANGTLVVGNGATVIHSTAASFCWNAGVDSGEHWLSDFYRTSTASDALTLIGYRANGSSVTGNLIRSGNSLPLYFGTSTKNTALKLLDDGSLLINHDSTGAIGYIDIRQDDSSAPIAAFGGTTSLNSAYPGYIYFSAINTINFGYNVNANTDGWINYRGYQNGTSQFRDLNIGDGQGNAIAFFDGSTGRVGIGTTSPDSNLHIDGTNSIIHLVSTNFSYLQLNAGSNLGLVQVEYSGNMSIASSNQMILGAGGSSVVRVDYDATKLGRISVGGADWQITSAASSTITSLGSLGANYTNYSSTGDLGITNCFVHVTAGITRNLPSAAHCPGRAYFVVSSTSSTFTVAATGSDLILYRGSTFGSLSSSIAGTALILVSNGSDRWVVFNANN